MRFFVFVLLFSLNGLFIFAQDSTNYVFYDKNYKFNEGLFLTFDQVITNTPVGVSNIFTTLDKTAYDFFDILLFEDEVVIIDDQGNQIVYKSEDIWGYSANNKLYINWEKRPALIPFVGSISHFMGVHVYNDYPYVSDPFYYQPQPVQKTEIRQYLLDFETGEVYDFNFRNIDPLLSKDIELYSEWSNLSNRKKKKTMFVYVRKYNDRNPLMLPKNN
ncbi:MAG: hypothetical protein JXR68_04820 [Bacteroidales bacterium]|nr:hypothetical protein [Bacteroidales bacterium]